MSFKEHDKRTYIIDSANAFTDRKISKREFLRRMGLAGIGFSSFGLGMLGGHRRGVRSFGIAAAGLCRWIAGQSGQMAEGGRQQIQGHQDPLHFRSDAADRRAQPDQEGVHRPDRHRGRDRDRAARAGARQGHAGCPGPARHLRPLLSRPVMGRDVRAGLHRSDRSTTRTSPNSRCRTSTWTISRKPLVEGLSLVDGKWMGIPFDIPIFILMYRKDLLEKHGIKVPTTYRGIHRLP